MLQKIYIIRRESYDYFGGDKEEDKQFSSLIQAFRYYKEKSKYDFSYDDGSYVKHKLFTVFRFNKEIQPKHGLVFGYKPSSWERELGFTEKVTTTTSEVRDIEVTPYKTEEYIFDNGEVIF